MRVRNLVIVLFLFWLCGLPKFLIQTIHYNPTFLQIDPTYNLIDFPTKIKMVIMSLILLLMPNVEFWRKSVCSGLTTIPYLLLTGGVISNSTEGILYSGVFDYIPYDLPNGDKIIYNVADVVIAVGWLTLIPAFFIELFKKFFPKKSAQK